jgi:hypothetical protein
MADPMTDDEVQKTATWLFELWKDACRRAKNRTSTPQTEQRDYYAAEKQKRRLAIELGRRMGGWTWNPRDYSACELHGGRDRNYLRDLPPHHDHGSGYRLGRRPVATVIQPYDYTDTMGAEMKVWAAQHDLLFLTPDYPSWWLPRRTTLCLFVRPDALASRTDRPAADHGSPSPTAPAIQSVDRAAPGSGPGKPHSASSTDRTASAIPWPRE